MKKIYLIVAAGLGLAQPALFCTTAHAQDSTRVLNDVVVTATRSPQQLSEIGRVVTVITAEHSSALTLLREAVRMDDTKPYVFQIVDGELKRREVEVSIQNLTQVEITSGLPEHSVVVLSSADSKPLLDGARAKVVP